MVPSLFMVQSKRFSTQRVVALVEKHANSQMQKDGGVLGTNELFQLTFTTHFTSEAARTRCKETQGVCHNVALPFTLKKYL